MALSNAERQKRYRENLKAAARRVLPSSEADGSDEDGKTLLVESYFAAGRALMQKHLDGDNDAVAQAAHAALAEFEAQDLTWLDLVGIMEQAGQAASCAAFLRQASAILEAMPKPAPPAIDASSRRRRPRVT